MKWPQKIRQYDIPSKQTGCHPDWERTFLLLHNKVLIRYIFKINSPHYSLKQIPDCYSVRDLLYILYYNSTLFRHQRTNSIGKGNRIFDRHSFNQKRLIVEQCSVFFQRVLILFKKRRKLFEQRMRRVEFKHALRLYLISGRHCV